MCLDETQALHGDVLVLSVMGRSIKERTCPSFNNCNENLETIKALRAKRLVLHAQKHYASHDFEAQKNGNCGKKEMWAENMLLLPW